VFLISASNTKIQIKVMNPNAVRAQRQRKQHNNNNISFVCMPDTVDRSTAVPADLSTATSAAPSDASIKKQGSAIQTGMDLYINI